MDRTPASTVKSATRTLDVLELMIEKDRPMPAAEIANALSIPVSSLSYLLAALFDRGYISRKGRDYILGRALERLNRRPGFSEITDRSAALVRDIQRELNETTSFFVRRGDEMEAIATAVGNHALQYTTFVGQRAPLHSFSAGKAILASMTDIELDDYLNHSERLTYTPKTTVAANDLHRQIGTIRESGIARADEEHTVGIVGIGRAARRDQETIGAFSIAIPLGRYSSDVYDRAVALLSRACDCLDR